MKGWAWVIGVALVWSIGCAPATPEEVAHDFAVEVLNCRSVADEMVTFRQTFAAGAASSVQDLVEGLDECPAIDAGSLTPLEVWKDGDRARVSVDIRALDIPDVSNAIGLLVRDEGRWRVGSVALGPEANPRRAEDTVRERLREVITAQELYFSENYEYALGLGLLDLSYSGVGYHRTVPEAGPTGYSARAYGSGVECVYAAGAVPLPYPAIEYNEVSCTY